MPGTQSSDRRGPVAERARHVVDRYSDRARIASAQHKIERTVLGGAASADSILDAVVRLEGKVEEAEAELEIRRGFDGSSTAPSLERRLDLLEQDEEIEKRLAELKKKIAESKA